MVVVAYESSTGPDSVTSDLVFEESFDVLAAVRVSTGEIPEVA